VRCSPALKWSLALLLPLTLAWKLASIPNDQIDVQNGVMRFLAQQKFIVGVTIQTTNGTPIIRAVSGSCRLLVARMLPLQDSMVQIQSLATTSDHIFIVFRGAIYEKQPVLLTVSNYLWFRFLVASGLASHVPSVLAVISSCDAQQLPWRELQSI
jgi:hypothetical protein